MVDQLFLQSIPRASVVARNAYNYLALLWQRARQLG
jgi:hypothetical protein